MAVKVIDEVYKDVAIKAQTPVVSAEQSCLRTRPFCYWPWRRLLLQVCTVMTLETLKPFSYHSFVVTINNVIHIHLFAVLVRRQDQLTPHETIVSQTSLPWCYRPITFNICVLPQHRTEAQPSAAPLSVL